MFCPAAENAEEKNSLPNDESPTPGQLSKQEILRKRGDFRKIFAEGRRIRGRIGQLITMPWPQKRVAFVVGKQCGNAVTRNKLRRYLREFYRAHKTLLPKNTAIVFQIFPQKKLPTYSQIQNEFLGLCEQL